MTKYFVTILLVSAVLIYGISRMAGLGFEALWSAIGFTEREERRVKALNELIEPPVSSGGAAPATSRPVIFTEGDRPINPPSAQASVSYDLKIGMSLSELLLSLGKPIRCRDEGKYSYYTYGEINVLLKDRRVVGWAQRQ